MTSDPTDGVTSVYDAENRIATATKNAVTTTYAYDSDGNRVKKSNGSAPSSGTLYWYMTPGIVGESDLSGNLTAEYVFFDGERVERRDGVNGAGGVFYSFSDHLKTASVITDSAGNIRSESDFYPWGGELQFVNNDSNHYKFTGKERDTETQLDYFGARYYSNGLGRFISADWSAKPVPVPYADFTDPQSMNLYTYVRNIPTTRIDVDGHEDDTWDMVKAWLKSIIQPAMDVHSSKGSSQPVDRSPVDPVTGITSRELVVDTTDKMATSIEVVHDVVSFGDLSGLGGSARSMMEHNAAGAMLSVALVHIPGGGSLNVALREAKVAKNLTIVSKYTDAALSRSAAKAEKSIARHAADLTKAKPEARNSMMIDIRKAAERLKAIRLEQAKRAAEAAQ